MKRSLFFATRILSVIPLLFFFCGGAFSESKPDVDQQLGETKEAQKVSYIQIYSWATILPKELIDLQARIGKTHKTASLKKSLPGIAKEIDRLKWDTTILQTTPGLQLAELAGYQTRAQKITVHIKNLQEPLEKAINTLTFDRGEWRSRKEEVVEIRKFEENAFPLAEEQYTKLLETVDQALLLIETRLKEVLQLGKKIGDLQVDLYLIDSNLESLERELRTSSIQQTAPSMLSSSYYSKINANLVQQSYTSAKRSIAFFAETISQNNHVVVIFFAIMVCCCWAIVGSRKFAYEQSRWKGFSASPLATTIFLFASINLVLDVLPLYLNFSQQVVLLLHIATLLAFIQLAPHLVKDIDSRKVLVRLTIFTIISMVLFFFGLSSVPHALFAFFASLVSCIFYLARLKQTNTLSGIRLWLNRGWGVFPAGVLLAGILGYDQLVSFLFSTILSTVIATVIVWTIYKLHLALLELLLIVSPFTILKENHAAIVTSMRPVVGWFHLLLLIGLQCVIWELFPTINKALEEITDFGFDILGLKISPGFLLTVFIIGYGAYLISKGVQVLLLTKVLPRYNAEKGVQLSIARLVHYAILTVGFIIMLRILGFQLNQLTLLGGALGVGIGFGLQAIVNNFASGLILLFERPIKVGDTIMVGEDFGEVKQLGLRATIIQTFDNSEIVIPNSDLITGQVTNWTLADRKVRVKVPVGVAYGTDIAQVLEILKACAEVNPMVLNTPQPQAFFLAFGSSSLDFELRVWIPEFLDRVQVLSDLNQDIENEFAIANIEVPFPQSDLHIRTVADEAAQKLSEKQ